MPIYCRTRVEEDSGKHTVTGWATDISAGPEDEADQTLNFIVTTDNDSLFAVKPAIDATTGTLTYTLADNAFGKATVTVKLQDNGGTENGGKDTFVQTFTITVTNVNDEPVITSNGGGDEASVKVKENTTAVTTVTAEDVDEGTTLVFSIAGGDDAALFAINPATGVLTFKTAPNYEEPSDKNGDGDYEVIVQVSDGELTDSQKITVTVTDVNDAPVITSNGGEETAIVEVEENTTAVTTVTATDEDGDALTYAITGGADADLFSIDPVTGELAFITAPD